MHDLLERELDALLIENERVKTKISLHTILYAVLSSRLAKCINGNEQPEGRLLSRVSKHPSTRWHGQAGSISYAV